MSSLRAPSAGVRWAVHGTVYLLALTMILPFAWMVSTSLKTDAEALGGATSFLPGGWVWEWRWGNYLQAVRSASLDRFYANSLMAAGITTGLATAWNALAGFAFAKMRFQGERMLFGATLATMMLPVQVYFIFAYIFADTLGYVNNMQALVVPFLASGFGIFYMRQAISTVPDALLEAGRIDGMSDFELFWTVVRPAVWPAMAALGVFTFVSSWNAFFWPLIVIDSVESKTLPLAVADLAAGRYVQSWPVRMAAATIITVPMVVVFLVFQRAFVRGMALAGIKE